ncbi:GAF domain-containing protein [Kineococcus sp. SYSU DK002]|uniref:GAF domain-containing protein n=1 Tax=Kineococcus sp. SYSU DK002 TaxID=3383123 RepID=UPI003D7EDB50
MGEPAVGAGQDPRELARRLRRTREAVLGSRRRPADVRPVIAASWERVRRSDLDPSGGVPGRYLDGAGLRERRAGTALVDALPAVRAHLRAAADAVGQVVVVADAGGAVLWRQGSPAARRRADALGFTEGSVWTEDSVGTNAIGTALVVDAPVHVFAAEHYAETHQPWTCAAAPVHDPAGRVLGVVDLSGPAATVHPGTLSLVAATARVAELEIAALHERRHRPLAALTGPGVLVVARDGCVVGGASAGSPVTVRDGRAVVPGVGRYTAEEVPGGWLLRAPDPAHVPARLELTGTGVRWCSPSRTVEVPLSPRHRQLVELLAASPRGLSAAQVAQRLFGDGARAVSARAELSRLRRLLGPVLASRPYRLTVPVGER